MFCMENNSIQNELDGILDDLNRINLMVSQKEKDLAQVKEIYITQEGSESYKLHIDQNIFYINHAELEKLAKQLEELGITLK